MSVGLTLLVIVTILVLLGVCRGVLDKMGLNDRQALIITGALFVGGLIPDIPLGGEVYVNIGGALIPLAVCVYLIVRAGTAKERVRALIGALVTGLAVYWLGRFMPDEPEAIAFDPNYIYGLVGGLTAYLLGRSRRGAFVAGVLGVMGADIYQAVELRARGVNQALHLGGAGAVDVIVIAGLTGVILAEVVGEIIERVTRGATRDESREFKDGKIRRRDGE
ncbi:MAG: DUF1614 domain-containing protein [Clostridiales bacterium]|nr:DUF1614 domain-containing protein [Clostridiales bacterium]MDY4199586.1 DUF1614 domain-containing protein [Candidatus Fimadaptatus sp.]